MVSKRFFYENDDQIVTEPGINREISEELSKQESAHGNISFVQGMGVRTNAFLESYTKQIRQFMHNKFSIYEAELNTQATAAKNEVESLKQSICSSTKEELLPNVIYILTASFTGSILVNRKALPLRFFTPVIFGGFAFKTFMPQTFETWKDVLLKKERETIPELYNYQVSLKSEAQAWNEKMIISKNETKSYIRETIHNVREYIVKVLSEK